MMEVQKAVREAIQSEPNFRQAAVGWFVYCCDNLDEPLLSKGIDLGKALLHYQNCFEDCKKKTLNE